MSPNEDEIGAIGDIPLKSDWFERVYELDELQSAIRKIKLCYRDAAEMEKGTPHGERREKFFEMREKRLSDRDEELLDGWIADGK